MANIQVTGFLGMLPRRGARLLDATMAARAQNVRALSGHLRGRPSSVKIGDVDPSARRVHHIISETHGEMWLHFDTPNVDVVRGPLVNDRYERYYWAGEGVAPQFNTAERIKAGDPPYKLGVPREEAKPTLTKQAAGEDPEEDRFYVYTLVDALGQESPPSDAAFVSGVQAGQDVMVDIPQFSQRANRPEIEKVRIYRTVPGTTTTAFFYVDEIDFGTWQYLDDNPPDDVAYNALLPSITWFPPPNDLAGMVVMPNGFLAGFRGNDVWFSEPYRPHAWPDQYTVSVEDEIVGLGVFGTYLVILTTGVPYVASGANPASVSLTRVGPYNACLSRRSIVSMAASVLYASEDGIVAVGVGGQQIITRQLIDRNTWVRDYNPSKIVAALDGETTYLAFYDGTRGFEFDFAEPERGLLLVDFQEGPIDAVDQDYEGRRAIVTSGGEVYEFAMSNTKPVPYVWRSKEFFMPKPVNLGAVQINAEPTAISFDYPARGLAKPKLEFELVADGRSVFKGDVAPNDPRKLPSGYKAQVFQFTLTGDMPVSRVTLAQSEREMGGL